MPHSRHSFISKHLYFFYHITKLSLLEKEKAEMIIFHLHLFAVILI
ncbi:hypothetical protein CN941_00660 [Bacillus cereus]|nr:hypothetical protein CON40_15860 [Bacillus cereus]PET98212.1 hypothetical protein CN527_17420 [Bacillus cereus]PEW04842.1 hypothetical protein CN428_08505 [Bacillus cereus]PEZ86878.1 hypothetical protein CN374_20430 [Bacillus cereus]PFA34727.1 hypothetical protein CN390_07460 [Bacillus cereus]